MENNIFVKCRVSNGSYKSSFYYEPIPNDKKKKLLKEIEKVFEEIPIYVLVKVHQQLLEDGHNISLNTVFQYRRELNLKPILAVKPINITTPIKEHKKYPYQLRGMDINRINQVWLLLKLLSLWVICNDS